MEDENSTYERTAQAIAAFKDALPIRLGASSADEGASEALSSVQRILSGIHSLRDSESDDMQAILDSVSKDLLQALAVLLSHDQDQTYDLIAQLQNYVWLNIIPCAWRLHRQAHRLMDPEQPSRLRLEAQHLSVALLEWVATGLSAQPGVDGETQRSAESAYSRGAAPLVPLIVRVLTWKDLAYLDFVGLAARKSVRGYALFEDKWLPLSEEDCYMLATPLPQLQSFLYRLGENAKYGRKLLRQCLSSEQLGCIWLAWRTYEESCDTMTLAWAIRPVVNVKDKSTRALQQHYASFFKKYRADKTDEGDEERKAAIDEVIDALVKAKKDDWDAVIFQVHEQLGRLDIDKPQLFRALSVHSPQQNMTHWLTWPKLDDHARHDVVVDAAFVVEWHDRQSNTSVPIPISFAAMHPVKVEENKASAPDRAITQNVFTFELKGTLTFTLEDGRKEKFGPRLKVALSPAEGARLQEALKARGVSLESHRRDAKRVRIGLLPEAIDKLLTKDPPGHPAFSIKSSVAPTVTPPSSVVGSRAADGPQIALVSQRRHEVAHLAGLQSATPESTSQNTASAEDQVAQARPLWDDDSDLTELSEESGGQTNRVLVADMEALDRPGLALPRRGSSNRYNDEGATEPPPASLQTHHDIDTPKQTFRKTWQRKRGRSVDDSDREESSDGGSFDKRHQKTHQDLQAHSNPHHIARDNAKRKRAVASDPPRPKGPKSATKWPEKGPLTDKTQMTKNAITAKEGNDDVLEHFLPPAPSPPPLRSSKKSELQKKPKRLTAEWMSSANVKLVQRRMQSTEALAAASNDEEDRMTSSDGLKEVQNSPSGLLGEGNTKRARNGLRIKGAATGEQDLSRTSSLQSSTAKCRKDSAIGVRDLTEEPQELMNLQVGAGEDNRPPQPDSPGISGILEPDRCQSLNSIDKRAAQRPSSPTSPSQIALERQRSRHAVPKGQGPVQSAPSPTDEVGDAIQISATMETSSGPPAATARKSRDAEAEAAEPSSTLKMRQPHTVRKAEADAEEKASLELSSSDESDVDEVAAQFEKGHKRSAVEEAITTTSSLVVDRESPSESKASKKKSENVIAAKATGRGTGKRLAAPRPAADLAGSALPDPRPSSVSKKKKATTIPLEPQLDLASDEPLKMVFSGKSSDEIVAGTNDPVPILAGPLDRDELEQHLVKSMNGLRAVYKGLAKSGFSDDIDDFEDPACDQKSKSVLALESAARTTLKLGQFLYDLATKKDECERRERDEINRRKISDKVDVMSDRLQGVLNEAGDVIQVLQSVDAWVNRHERGKAGGGK